MSDWPGAGLKAMCHLGMTKGTLRIPLVPLKGLSSQPGGGWKHNPGKLHSCSQRGPLLSVARTAAGPLAWLPIGQSQRLSMSPRWGCLGKGLPFIEHQLCARSLQLSPACPFHPCLSLIRLATITAPISCMGKVRLDWGPAPIIRGCEAGLQPTFPPYLEVSECRWEALGGG